MRRRPAVTLFAAALLFASCSPAFAQLGGLMKKVPKVPAPPSVPSPVSSPAPSPAEDQALLTSCEQLKQVIDALKAERQALEQGAREASAAKARLDAEKAGGSDAQQERMMGALEAGAAKEQKYKDCLDAAMLKDPDNPKLERLEMQAEDELDDAKADKLTQQADALRKVIRQRAEPACASLKASIGADMQAFNEAEVARRQREEELMAGVDGRAEQAGASAAGMSKADYATLKEGLCVSIVSSRLNPNDRALIEQCGSDLPDALRAIGCGSGSPWGAPTPAIK
jgi:hypothetical protein